MIRKLERMKKFETLKSDQYAIYNICINDNTFMSLCRIFNYTKNPYDDLVKHKDNLEDRFDIVEQFGCMEK